jgi:hypothetical protein
VDKLRAAASVRSAHHLAHTVLILYSYTVLILYAY